MCATTASYNFKLFEMLDAIEEAQEQVYFRDFRVQKTSKAFRPIRPKGNNYQARLWDSLYNDQNVSSDRNSVLKQDILQQFRDGQPLMKVYKKVNALLPQETAEKRVQDKTANSTSCEKEIQSVSLSEIEVVQKPKNVARKKRASIYSFLPNTVSNKEKAKPLDRSRRRSITYITNRLLKRK